MSYHCRVFLVFLAISNLFHLFFFKIFQGNTKIDVVVEQRLSRTILARFLRIVPDIWSGNPVLRMEVTGSYVGKHYITDIFALKLGICMVKRTQDSCKYHS